MNNATPRAPWTGLGDEPLTDTEFAAWLRTAPTEELESLANDWPGSPDAGAIVDELERRS